MSESVMKLHLCPTCGGNLNIDLKRQMYECPFCGVTFDYSFFEEDDVLDRAEKSLSSGEFISAKKGYEFVLSKDLRNFVALRGMAMISLRIRTIASINQTQLYRKLDVEKAKENIKRISSEAKSEHQEYFKLMMENMDLGVKCADETEKMENYRERINSESAKRADLEIDRNDVYANDPDQPQVSRPKFVAKLIAGYIIFSLILLFASGIWLKDSYHKSSFIYPILGIVILGIFVAVISYNALKQGKYYEQDIRFIGRKINTLNSNVDNHKKRIDELKTKMRANLKRMNEIENLARET